ncbi:uncharacterized protein LOC135334748 [Halichondria panicea]|uniref:uncharacterized protein LOC135334748 n=1 Tax=Halichondria panicea TaxID=6063 RepID=UPI00312B469A
MTRTCQVNGIWSSSEPTCEFIVLSIGGTAYTNNTALSFSLIEEGSSALTCHTELSTCCREQDNLNGGALGGWRGPDGNSIPKASNACSSEGLYVTRGISTISLNLRGTEILAGGVYCCTIPRAGGITQTFCVNVQFPIPATEPASTYIDGRSVDQSGQLEFSTVTTESEISFWLSAQLSPISYQLSVIRLASPTEPPDTDHTGEIISFSDVGSGVATNPPAWYCYTNPGGAAWKLPNGDSLPVVGDRAAVGNELFINVLMENTAV